MTTNRLNFSRLAKMSKKQKVLSENFKDFIERMDQVSAGHHELIMRTIARLTNEKELY